MSPKKKNNFFLSEIVARAGEPHEFLVPFKHPSLDSQQGVRSCHYAAGPLSPASKHMQTYIVMIIITIVIISRCYGSNNIGDVVAHTSTLRMVNF